MPIIQDAPFAEADSSGPFRDRFADARSSGGRKRSSVCYSGSNHSVSLRRWPWKL